MDRFLQEDDARMVADLYKRMANSSAEDLPKLAVEGLMHRFDRDCGLLAACVSTYQEADDAVAAFQTASDWVLTQARTKIFRFSGRSPFRQDFISNLKLQLTSRVAHWTAEALRRARSAAAAPAAGVGNAASVVATSVEDRPPERPVNPLPFPRRAEWLQRQLQSRKWTIQDLERFGGPSWKSGRKILNGQAVKETVLQKTVHALCSFPNAPQISLKDIPQD